MGYADCCPFLHELDGTASWWRKNSTSCWAAPSECKAAAGPRAQGGRRRTWTTCWSSCRRSCATHRALAQHPRVLALRDDARPRLSRLVARTAQWLQKGRVSEEAALRMADWIEPLLRRESYLALLVERPACTSGCCACWARRAGRRAT
jgi:glutamate-ammonia-ligase adenylyltransferase